MGTALLEREARRPEVVVEGHRADASTELAAFPVGKRQRRTPKPPISLWRRFARDLTRGMVFVALLHLFVLQISVVRGHSMEPSLRDGDRLVVDRISYSFVDVERFDVVVMRNPRNHDVDYVKRIVGLPGDVIQLRAGHVQINGETIDEEFLHITDSDTTRSLTVPPGHFYVLGDNRPISSDSREFGLVDAELLKGKVRLRFWPLDRVEVF